MTRPDASLRMDALIDDLCAIIRPRVKGDPQTEILARALVNAAEIADRQQELTPGVTIGQILAGDMLWAAAQLMGYGDGEDAPMALTRDLIAYAAERTRADAQALRRALWAKAKAHATRHLPPDDQNQPKPSPWDIAEAWGALRVEMMERKP